MPIRELSDDCFGDVCGSCTDRECQCKCHDVDEYEWEDEPSDLAYEGSW